MEIAPTVELVTARDDALAAIEAIPESTLEWQPGGTDWSPRSVVGHMACTNVFYLAVIEQARAAGFGTIRLDPTLGLERWRAIETEIAGCASIAEVRDGLERAGQRLLETVRGLPPADLDWPFVFLDQQPGEPAVVMTTLRRRDIERASEHLREHLGQLSDTLRRWRMSSA